jgi:mono/diheme cytochrome c family protein
MADAHRKGISDGLRRRAATTGIAARGLSAWVRSPLWFAVLAVVLGVTAYAPLRDFTLDVETTPAERGWRIALEYGCFACHGPAGSGGVKNPGSKDGEVPGFSGGTPMMWAQSEDELRAYILDGAPARKRSDARHQGQMRAQALVMPAYRDYLSDAEVDDLMAYIRAVSGLVVPPDELARKGQDLAYRFACFHCHGPMGSGGVANPGSLKGYIPGWWGKDFRDLVRSDDELRAWIADGRIERLQGNALARHFTEAQRTQMPAYGKFLDDDQLAALVRYVRWINDGEWQDEPLDLGH